MFVPLRHKTRLKRKQIGEKDTITNKLQKTMKKKIQKYMKRETALFVHVIIAALCLQISIFTLCAPLLALSLVLLFTITLY